jgi:hypothetical protein
MMWAALTTWDTVQAQLFSESWQKNTPPVLDVVSDQPWYLWTIIALVLLLLITAEGAYRHSRAVGTPAGGGEEGTRQAPILADKQLYIDMDRHMFADAGTEGFPVSKGGTHLWLRAEICLNAAHYMNVESLELEVLARRIPSDWQSDTVGGGVLYVRYVYFDIPGWVGSGEHVVRFVAFAESKWWRSDDYTIAFPVNSQ